MLTPAIPLNERERLASLHSLEILDTPPEERFDRLTRLAAGVFGVPMAYIALVEANRQWFKAKCGLSIDSSGRETSFCGHTILQHEALVIPDALRDERFADNPLVVGEPGIRFYAGHPLRGPGGHNVGTLCLADRLPRQLSPHDRDLFAELARIAEHELGLVDLIRSQRDLIRTKNELLRTREQLALELEHAAAFVRGLLPPCEGVGEVRLDWRFVPSSNLGGDFLGFFALPSGDVAFYLFDVAGHGVASSLLAVSAHNSIRHGVLRHGVDGTVSLNDPGAVLAAMNDAFPMGQNGGKFITMWYGVLDPRTGTLRYASAGHHPAVVVRDGRVLDLGAEDRDSDTGLPLGVLNGGVYPTAATTLRRGDRLYLYSDGLFETWSPAGELLGRDALHALLPEVEGPNTGRLDRLIERVLQLADQDGFKDDVSVLEVEWGSEAPAG